MEPGRSCWCCWPVVFLQCAFGPTPGALHASKKGTIISPCNICIPSWRATALNPKPGVQVTRDVHRPSRISKRITACLRHPKTQIRSPLKCNPKSNQVWHVQGFFDSMVGRYSKELSSNMWDHQFYKYPWRIVVQHGQDDKQVMRTPFLVDSSWRTWEDMLFVDLNVFSFSKSCHSEAAGKASEEAQGVQMNIGCRCRWIDIFPVEFSVLRESAERGYSFENELCMKSHHVWKIDVVFHACFAHPMPHFCIRHLPLRFVCCY